MRSGSKNITGSGSRMAESSKPYARLGLEGMTTRRPGIWANSASTLSLWCSGEWMPAP
ncbi:hypothetical protein D3C84_1170070 [compost metagenome]